LTVDVDDIEYTVPVPVFSVLVGNLLRNAIQYTIDGTVRCCVSSERILIENACLPGDQDQADRGFGVGLEIVKRICERLEWTLVIGPTDDETMRASIEVPAEVR
jgi:signal transduction histidine kinase